MSWRLRFERDFPHEIRSPVAKTSSVWAATLVVFLVSLFGGCRSHPNSRRPGHFIHQNSAGGTRRPGKSGCHRRARRGCGSRSAGLLSMPGPDRGGYSRGQTNLSFRSNQTIPGAHPRTSGLSMPPCWSIPAMTRRRLSTWPLLPGGSVAAVETVKGVGAIQLAPTKPLKFSGYDWNVRTIAGDRGGLNNLYDADNAWTDDSGALHLRIKKRAGRWACAEVEAVAKSRIRNLHHHGAGYLWFRTCRGSKHQYV